MSDAFALAKNQMLRLVVFLHLLINVGLRPPPPPKLRALCEILKLFTVEHRHRILDAATQRFAAVCRCAQFAAIVRREAFV